MTEEPPSTNSRPAKQRQPWLTAGLWLLAAAVGVALVVVIASVLAGLYVKARD